MSAVMNPAAYFPASVAIWKETCRAPTEILDLPLICSKILVLSILTLICNVTLDVSSSFVHSMGSIWLLKKVLDAGDALRLACI